MNLMKWALQLLTSAVLFTNCTTGLAGGDGGGSEITNGKIVAMDGAPLAGKIVNAYPSAYVQGSTGTGLVIPAVTANDGSFEFDFDSGSYTLYFVDTASGSGICLRSVLPGDHLGTLRLDKLGTIAGTVRVADSSDYRLSLVVYSRGTPLRSSIASGDSAFTFGLVPSGTYPLSLAKQRLTGCAPGQDCIPGTGQPGAFVTAVVSDGATIVFESTVKADAIGTLP